jgi:hypothetical protein
MLIQMTIHPGQGWGLLALCDALRRGNLQIAGDIRQLADLTVELRADATCASDVRALCTDLVERRVAQSVSVQRIDAR